MKKIHLKLSKETKIHLEAISLLTGISIDGIITGILWDFVLEKHDEEKRRKHDRKKVALQRKGCENS